MTVELNMPGSKPKAHLLDMGKPQLRMVDLNLLTVFDAVMKREYCAPPTRWNVAACGRQRRSASEGYV